MSENRPIGFHKDPRSGRPMRRMNNHVIPAEAVEATEPQPEPCEYCSIAANTLKVHDGSCDGMTEQEWRDLRAMHAHARSVPWVHFL